MRIILLNLPWRQDSRWGVRAGSRWPFTSEPEKDGYIKYIPFPFFLAHAASLLENKDNEIKFIDAIAQRLDEQATIDEIDDYKPSLVVIETSTPSFANDIRISEMIKRRVSNSSIVLCGPHASSYAKNILDKYDFINYILIGEYEYALLDLVDSLKNSLNLRTVLGLVFRSNHTVITNKPRQTLKNLDDLPWPHREAQVIYKYNDGFAGLPVPNVQMYSSRGCPFHCIFCLWPQVLYGEHKYRKRDPVKVVNEMEWLIKKFNFKAVYFDDDVFNIDKTHVTNICNEIIKRNIKVPWAIMARADLMNERLLSSLAGAGLYAVKYGIESANSKVLKLCKKNMNLIKAKKMIQFSKGLGIRVHLTFCLGLPGETKQSIQDTLNFISETKPDSLQFSLATPFPGTDYFKYLEKRKGGLPVSWIDYDGNNKYFAGSEELINLDLERLKRDLCSNLNLK